MTETIHIYGPIGEGENTPPRIGAFLDDNAGVPVVIAVNSYGGIASDGAAILAQLDRHGQVRVEVLGVAASAASLLVMGAAEIAMHRAAHLMIHEPSNLAWGTADDLRREAGMLDKISETYAQAYARATGHPVERIRAWMAAETWMTADEALALNFCDSLFGDEEAFQSEPVAAFDYTRFKAAPPELVRLAARNGWTGNAA
ncbi:head maturation protease, ClpP-related [Rhodovulum sulfidophilum]|uniref:ATP-dependent Clp protease proteolytic subunit n=1 Tax=Rhodovulum sulfidophilum TaxID=35806 RepID=A0ABS1S1G6_RHOSU|nr:head maturation protease, ClpP-related [Rhodovulum sulfidophilum]MBL3611034.1 Clp protease ClpP [Rhodovulum sulfidophilum]